MISLRTRQKSASNTASSRFAKVLLLLPLVLAAVLLFERVRGQFTLKVMAREMTTKGEARECKQLWPAPSRLGLEFTNSLHELTKSLPRSLLSYAGQITCFVQAPSGRWQRGSQQPSPVMYYGNSETQTWSNLESAVKSAEPALAALRQLMKNPPAALGYDAEAALRRDEFPNYIAFRIGAQSLHAAACCALHKHDLSGAIENLAALEGFVKLGENDPTLIGLMIRVAVLGMSIDVLWDALHSDGWSDESLAALQDICVRHRNILSQMPKAAEAERISHLYTVDWFRTHTYNESLSRYEPIVASFGGQPAAIERAVAPRAWRQWIFHPLWSFTWA